MTTEMAQVETWIVDALRSAGRGMKLGELIRHLEASRPLSPGDREPQKGHEHESKFAYRCRWAVTRLRNTGVLRRPTDHRGIVVLADQDAADVSASARVDPMPETQEPRVWIFQANPKFYRIFEAIETLDRIQFLTNRYKDHIQVGDVVLLWISGKQPGIYAQARVAEGVAERETDGDDAAFWTDPASAATPRPRVVLAIEQRLLAHPVLKNRIAATEGLADLMILRQPIGTNFPVSPEEWQCLRPLLEDRETPEPAPDVVAATRRRAHGGKFYDETCGSLHDQLDTARPAKTRPSPKAKTPSPIERNRRLLAHLARFGELTPGDLDDLGLDESHLGDWLDSLLVRRPESDVVTPLFLHLVEGDDGPSAFTTRLAARFLGEHLRRHAPEPIPEIEEHVWTRFGRWHLPQPHGGDQKTHAYLGVPVEEARDLAASERLDLFAQLPPKVIGNLIREPDFLKEQQSWSADAASRSTEGPLSTQLTRGWRRPLLLSTAELRLVDDGADRESNDPQVSIGEMERAEVVERSYIVSGLPLCEAGDWAPAARLGRDAVAERLCRHPIAAAIVQFEVQRLFAGLSGEPAAAIEISGPTARLELDGRGRGPLWRHLRTLLEQVGYWPVGTSTQDSLWVSAVHAMLKNLELLGVLERQGQVLRLTEGYQSLIKAHPAHPHNRGERPYRVRLSQFLTTLQDDRQVHRHDDP